MGALFFQPWMGTGYRNARDRRLGTTDNTATPGDLALLVLGESHYGSPEEQETGNTARIIRDCAFAPGPASRFFTKIANIVTDASSQSRSDDYRRERWEQIAFGNYVQSLLPGPRQPPSREQWLVGEAAYLEMLEQVAPTIVIVLGWRLWQNISPANCVTLGPIIPLAEGQALPESKIYNFYVNGQARCAHAFPIAHPSGRGFRTIDAVGRLKTAIGVNGAVENAGLTLDDDGNLAGPQLVRDHLAKLLDQPAIGNRAASELSA